MTPPDPTMKPRADDLSLPLPDKLMLYLFVVLFVLFSARLLGELISGLFR